MMVMKKTAVTFDHKTGDDDDVMTTAGSDVFRTGVPPTSTFHPTA